MRTTVRVEDAVWIEARKLAEATGQTLSSVVEEALRRFLSDIVQAGRSRRIRLPTCRGAGLTPGVDLDDSSDLLDRMEPVKRRLR